MALGVLNNLSAIYAENYLNNTNNSLQTVLQQLSSGSRINSGADDAAGLSLVNGLQANSTALIQSATNATEGVGLLHVADGALSQVTNLLNRAITLATEASNGTLNSSQASAANQEYQSILSEINNIGSTTTYNQQQVFAGNTVAIYTGDSSTTGSSVDNLYIRTLSSANVGDTAGAITYSNGANNVFIDLSKGGTNAAVTDSLGGTSTTINVSYLTKGAGGSTITATAPITVGTGTVYANTTQGLISAINNSGLGLNATFATAAQAGTTAVNTAKAGNATGGGATDTGIEISGSGVGTGTNGVGEVGALTLATSSDTLGGTLNIVGSDGKTHAITLGAPASTDTLANLAATINSDGYGVTASLNGAGTILTFTSANSAVTVSATSLTDTTPAIVNAGPTLASLAGTLSVAKNGDILGGTLTVTDTLGGAHPVVLGTPGVTDTLANLKNYLNVTHAAWGITATVNGAGTAMTFTGTLLDNIVAAGALTDTTPITTVNTSLTGTPTIETPHYAQVGTFTVAGAADALSGTLKIGGNTIALGVPGSTANISQLNAYINNGNFGVTASLNGAGTVITFTSANSAITFAGAPVDVAAPDPVVTTANADFSGYYSVGIAGTVLDGSTGGGTANTSMVLNADGTGGIATTGYADGAGENLSSTDLTTQANAQAALTSLNMAITDAAALDGYIGGQINTLQSVSSVLTTQQENVVSAQNAIQATDYASATSNMSKYEILSQTGIAALAQANSIQQEVTKLLQ